MLKKAAAGKSPGADGFPVEFWRRFWGVVGDDFMELVAWVTASGRVTESMSGGVIRLLFKKGDRQDVKNYRPVTLVNADYKLISGCVAARLSGVLPHLIHLMCKFLVAMSNSLEVQILNMLKKYYFSILTF